MLFSPWQLGERTAPNRLVRAATYEGLGDRAGYPQARLGDLYARLAAGGVGMIITGFCYVSRDGRAMQPGQCGIDQDEKIAAWQEVVARTRAAGTGSLLVMQLAHAGRQTLPTATGCPVVAPTTKASPYFRSRPRRMDDDRIRSAIANFVAAARRAQSAGFDAVELHAAHGYLIHQFLSPALNDRRDGWGRDRLAFLRRIVDGIRRECGPGLPILIKLSAGDDHPRGMTGALAADYAAQLADLGVAAVEVSYGTMDLALNIFRGGLPLQRALHVNPLLNDRSGWQRTLWRWFVLPHLRRRLHPFTENYNLAAARAIRRRTDLPLILVGGIRSLSAIQEILSTGAADAIALCRPLICEPDLLRAFGRGSATRSICRNCNVCAVMCDSNTSLRCYRKEKDDEDAEIAD